MTHCTCAGVGLLTLCTVASALAQAPASKVSPADLSGSQCSAVSNAPVPGQQLPTCPAAREAGQFAERFVHERLELWRQRLKLENWQISVVMIRRNDLKYKTLGAIRWDKDKKSAVISVLDAADYRLPFREMLDDMEFTIVHELIHLELASLPRSEASRSREEHAVNRLAEALLRLDRQQ